MLVYPKYVNPPRHGSVAQGILARILIEDLAAQVAAGRALEADSPTARDLQAWGEKASEAMFGLPPEVKERFLGLAAGFACCDSYLLGTGDDERWEPRRRGDPALLGRAYLALCLAYLEEVQEYMPDYIEASDRAAPKPQLAVTVSGGTFYGAQIAAQISNIDSTIAGVAQQGSTEMADALKALEQAVLSQADLGEDERRDLLDNIGYLADTAQTPPEKRNRGIVKSVLTALGLAATAGTELGQAVDTWGHVLRQLAS